MTAGLIINVVQASREKPLDNGIFDWVRKGGGIYHPAQEFRKEGPVAGVFATEDIPKGTLLTKIPWKLMIPSHDPNESGVQLPCGLVDRFKRELELGSESRFAPYVEYVKGLSQNSIPTMWSDTGKQLVREIVGENNELPPLDPLKWMENMWFTQCGGSWEDKVGVQAALVVITRSDDHILVPGKSSCC